LDGQWVSVKPVHHFPCNFVCREAQEVIRKAYVPLNAYDRSKEPWRAIPWDYSRDCVYFSKRACDFLSDTATGRFPSIKQLPTDPGRTKHVAINTQFIHSWTLYNFPGNSQFLNPGGRDLAIRRLCPILTIFNNLEILLLAIEGRYHGISGPDVLIPAAAECPDYYVENGREMCLDWISSIAQETRLLHTDLRVPEFRLDLLINDPPLVQHERRWDYSLRGVILLFPDMS